MSAAPLKVLVIDDEPPIRKLLRMGLTTQGYQILEAPNGKTALELLDQGPDLVILDLGLPDMQGLDLLRMLRGRNESVPVVVLSSRGDEAGKVQALDFGADDYVTKPFGMDELLARMRAALRHQLQVHGERPIFRVGELSVDLVRRLVKLGEKDVRLSPKEYEILRTLVQHAGRTPAVHPDRNRHRLSAARSGLNDRHARTHACTSHMVRPSNTIGAPMRIALRLEAWASILFVERGSPRHRKNRRPVCGHH